jgi:hypothetical protein
MASGAPFDKTLYFLVPFSSTCYTKVDILLSSDLNGNIFNMVNFYMALLAYFNFEV